MSNLDAVVKVADQILSRIFDQRQFTGGEINYLVKELDETVHLDSNFDRMLKINEKTCKISDIFNENMCLHQDAKLVELNESVGSLVSKAQRMLELESHYRELDEKNLGAKRREYEKRKQECVSKCNAKLEHIRECILEEELDLERKYLKFEENLRNK